LENSELKKTSALAVRFAPLMTAESAFYIPGEKLNIREQLERNLVNRVQDNGVRVFCKHAINVAVHDRVVMFMKLQKEMSKNKNPNTTPNKPWTAQQQSLSEFD
jgi:hypothetical protein